MQGLLKKNRRRGKMKNVCQKTFKGAVRIIISVSKEEYDQLEKIAISRFQSVPMLFAQSVFEKYGIKRDKK
jgi:hypothetical protein